MYATTTRLRTSAVSNKTGAQQICNVGKRVSAELNLNLKLSTTHATVSTVAWGQEMLINVWNHCPEGRLIRSVIRCRVSSRCDGRSQVGVVVGGSERKRNVQFVAYGGGRGGGGPSGKPVSGRGKRVSDQHSARTSWSI